MNRDELLLARRLGDYASRAPVAAMLSVLSAMIVLAVSQQGRTTLWDVVCAVWLLGIGAINALRVIHAHRVEADTIDFRYIRRQVRRA